MGVEQVSLERVQRLALVQLPGDLAPVGRVSEVSGGYVESNLSIVALRLGGGYRLASFAMNLDNRLS
ncbi:hypothetical protein ABZV14_44475 [Streptosporangium canum]|uniref:hypothetical protein n=1 Tax=Streptosporangium canum TaxID=324952 RepID=UPI0033AA81C2